MPSDGRQKGGPRGGPQAGPRRPSHLDAAVGEVDLPFASLGAGGRRFPRHRRSGGRREEPATREDDEPTSRGTPGDPHLDSVPPNLATTPTALSSQQTRRPPPGQPRAPPSPPPPPGGPSFPLSPGSHKPEHTPPVSFWTWYLLLHQGVAARRAAAVRDKPLAAAIFLSKPRPSRLPNPRLLQRLGGGAHRDPASERAYWVVRVAETFHWLGVLPTAEAKLHQLSRERKREAGRRCIPVLWAAERPGWAEPDRGLGPAAGGGAWAWAWACRGLVCGCRVAG